MDARFVLVRVSAWLACAWLAGCASLHHYAANRMGDALAGSGSSYASDDDPELIRTAAPFSLKLIESLLQETPQHTGLLTAAAGGFTQYAYAFVQQDADELEPRDVDAAFALRARARGLYLRGRDYGLRALESRHPGFRSALGDAPQGAVATLARADVPALYWTTVAWAASISLGKDSSAALADLPRVELLVMRLQQLDADFDHGALDTFLISYTMGRPGVRDPGAAAREHFERAVRLSDGQRAGPYVALAENVCARRQDRAEFIATLHQALAIDPQAQPQWRLENRIMQHRARWLLTQADQLFIE
jgi:predicted anti-sigma-YlaC factor YlaD